MDMSGRDHVLEDSPIFMTRAVADTGWIMMGGAAQVGSVDVTVATRSWTTCRAFRRSVPGLKMSSIEDSWGTDFDRMMSRASNPFSDCSSGTMSRLSPSAAVSPRQSVVFYPSGVAVHG